MAFWGNEDMLVNFIRHSFITCDETSVCEAVLEQPIIKAKPGAVQLLSGRPERHQGQGDADVEEASIYDDNGELQHSPDIIVEFGHRRRSNTSKRLESLKAERVAQSKVKVVTWRPTDADALSKDDLEQFFEPKPSVEFGKSSSAPKTSLLSKLLESGPSQPKNSFAEFAKFEGTLNPGSAVRSVTVFPLLSSFTDKTFVGAVPLTVVALSSARICDLVGLICYLYTQQMRQPPLKASAKLYSLHVAEDNGEIDDDLPPLNPNEQFGKFGFPFLALVETPVAVNILDSSGSVSGQSTAGFVQQHTRTVSAGGVPSSSRSDSLTSKSVTFSRPNALLLEPGHIISVFFSDGDEYKFELTSHETTLRDVRDKILEQRFAEKNEPYYKRLLEYKIEKNSEPGKALCLDAPVRSAGTSEFCLVRANSRRISLDESSSPTFTPPEISSPTSMFQSSFTDDSPTSSANLATAAVGPPCQYYAVSLIHKFRPAIDVKLGIASNRIEVIAAARRLTGGSKIFSSSGLSSTHSVVIHDMERVGGCEIMETRPGGRALFRIVHRGSAAEWKSHTFEAPLDISARIVETVNKTLDWKMSTIRNDFKNKQPSGTSSSKRLSAYLKRLQSLDLALH